MNRHAIWYLLAMGFVVWGVSYTAYHVGSLAMVAPPIAEALIATAMGLFAAIPAVVAFNRFSTKVGKLENAYINFMDEFSTILNRQLVNKGDQ